jgi:hypothetical protein
LQFVSPLQAAFGTGDYDFSKYDLRELKKEYAQVRGGEGKGSGLHFPRAAGGLPAGVIMEQQEATCGWQLTGQQELVIAARPQGH